MTKDEALKILEELGNSPNMTKHALACGFVMRDLCEYFSSKNGYSSESVSSNEWEIVGLLHDADYEMTDKSLERHTDETTQKLKEKGTSEEIIEAIRGHCDKAPRKTLMAKAIYACDELTGLIVACALVMPDKKLKSVKLKTVIKKFQDKSFARGANRNQIKTCESELDIPLKEFVAVTLRTMQDHASDLGL